MKENRKTIVKGVVFLLPFLLATAGFLIALHDGLLNAMYRAMRLYVIELDCEYSQVNILIEIARWTAPVMSAAAILTVLSSFFGMLKSWVRIHKGDAVAIHGDSDYAQLMADQLGMRTVRGKNAISMRAANHVLIFKEDQDMLSYLSANRKMMLRNNSRVYLCAEHLVRSNYKKQNLILCNFAEICARKYWRQFPMSVDSQEQCIVIIGFDSYGQQILTQGLLTNVFAPDSRICYHVFGDSQKYRCEHTELEQAVDVNPERPVRDSVWFHDEPWYEYPDVLSAADRIILAGDEEESNLLTLNDICTFFITGEVHIKVNNSLVLKDLWSNASAFGTVDSICTVECILDEDTMSDAKRIHAGYFRDCVCPKREECGSEDCWKCPQAQKNWSEQNAFTIYSNVAQADHFPVKLRILLGDDYQQTENPGQAALEKYQVMSPEERLKLAEIEHVRWARYHYVNNWRYAPERCNAKKMHPMLVPFSELSEENQRKDEAAWLNAFSLYRNN